MFQQNPKHPNPHVFNVDEHEFQEKVIRASEHKPILVDFWADWCAPCITIAPVLDQVVTEYDGRFQLAKVEVDEGDNMRLAGHYKLRGFPTLLLFINGEEVDRFSSHRPTQWIRTFLDKYLPA